MGKLCFTPLLAGDSRGLLCREQNEIIATEDHKPYMERERDRIIKAGGSVMIQRVSGGDQPASAT
jgi:serine/threonine protein phosphatase PrpC